VTSRFEPWVERQIREAQERGEFDDLPGKGQPIAGLDGEVDELWWVRGLMRREGISFTPETLALRRDVETALGRIGEVPTEASVRALVAALNQRIREANRLPTSGPPSSMMVLDVERVVDRWRAAQARE
jgi:hypothetical protein